MDTPDSSEILSKQILLHPLKNTHFRLQKHTADSGRLGYAKIGDPGSSDPVPCLFVGIRYRFGYSLIERQELFTIIPLVLRQVIFQSLDTDGTVLKAPLGKNRHVQPSQRLDPSRNHLSF
jgi:hypothetical protein